MDVFFSSNFILPQLLSSPTCRTDASSKSRLVLIVQLQSIANCPLHVLLSLIFLADDFFNFISVVFFAVSPCVNIYHIHHNVLRPRGARVALPYWFIHISSLPEVIGARLYLPIRDFKMNDDLGSISTHTVCFNKRAQYI